MDELIQRLSFKTTPKCWRKVRNIALIILAVGLAIKLAPLGLSEEVIELVKYINTIAYTVAGTSHLTKKDSNGDITS